MKRYLPLLHRAAESGDVNLVRGRLAKGDPVDKAWRDGFTALHIAAFEGHLSVVTQLLEAGANPNTADGQTGMAALHNACVNGHLDCAAVLLARGAKVNQRSKDGYTPIFDALIGGSATPDLIELLLSNGASANLHSKSGSTPLHEAASLGEGSICQKLIESGAQVSAKDRMGLFPEDYAMLNGHIRLALDLRSLRSN